MSARSIESQKLSWRLNAMKSFREISREYIECFSDVSETASVTDTHFPRELRLLRCVTVCYGIVLIVITALYKMFSDENETE